MDALWRVLLLDDYNTRLVVLGCALLGAACGSVGVFTVLRGRALVADALAHAALPGVCLAFLLLGTRSLPVLLMGALGFGALGILTLTWIRRATPVKEDAALAITLSVFFGLGVCLLLVVQQQPRGAHAGLEGFIFGKAASLVRADVIAAAGVAMLTLSILALGWRRFKVLTFDRDFARALGLPMQGWDLLLMALVCVCTVAALPAVGLVLAVALLTIPPAAARFWTDRLWLLVLLSALIGAASGIAGALLSATHGKFATGPVIVLVCAAMFVLSMLLAPRRGVLGGALRRARRRAAIAAQNLLRAMYEVEEQRATQTNVVEDASRGVGVGGMIPPSPSAARGFHGASSPQGCTVEELSLRRAWTAAQLDMLLRRAQRHGDVQSFGSVYRLTPQGRLRAARVVRAHRLWELFLIEQARIAPDHVDRDADAIEHILSEPALQELEQQLLREGRLPPELMPRSPHDVRTPSAAGVHA